MEIRDICQKELNTLWDETRRLVNPHKVYVDLSRKLYDMKLKILDEMTEKDWAIKNTQIRFYEISKNGNNIPTCQIGSTIGTHVGPGAIAVSFFALN